MIPLLFRPRGHADNLAQSADELITINFKEVVMAQDNSATGGMLVILGLLIALGIGFFLYKGGFFGGGHSGPEIKVELPAPKQ